MTARAPRRATGPVGTDAAVRSTKLSVPGPCRVHGFLARPRAGPADARAMTTAPTPAALPSIAGSLRRLRRARAVARFNGWSAIVFGVPALAFGLWSPTSAVVGIALLALGWRELALERRLTRLEPAACARLAVNQALLLAGVLAYCGWMTRATLTAQPMSERLPELERALGAGDYLDALVRGAMVAVYVTVAALSVAIQGLTAWYYATRRPHVEALLAAGDGPAVSTRDAAAA